MRKVRSPGSPTASAFSRLRLVNSNLGSAIVILILFAGLRCRKGLRAVRRNEQGTPLATGGTEGSRAVIRSQVEADGQDGENFILALTLPDGDITYQRREEAESIPVRAIQPSCRRGLADSSPSCHPQSQWEG